MKTPEDIKKAIACCVDGDCSCCQYRKHEQNCNDELLKDALEYINELEKSRYRYKALFEEKYDELQDAYKTIDSAENCSNCVYGDGTITGTNYCYDCRWFDGANNRLKWVGTVDALEEENNEKT